MGLTHAHPINVNMVYDVVSPFTGTFETLKHCGGGYKEGEEGRRRGGGERKWRGRGQGGERREKEGEGRK